MNGSCACIPRRTTGRFQVPGSAGLQPVSFQSSAHAASACSREKARSMRTYPSRMNCPSCAEVSGFMARDAAPCSALRDDPAIDLELQHLERHCAIFQDFVVECAQVEPAAERLLGALPQ